MGRRRRPALVRSQLAGFVRSRSRLFGQDRQRSRTVRVADRAADKVRADFEPQNGQRDWRHDPASNPLARRRGDRMMRREFIMGLGRAAWPSLWPLATRAQQPKKLPIIGFLHPGVPDAGSPVFDALRDGLREAGYVEGESVKVEARWARGNPELLPQLARELVQLRVDLIVATARVSIEAARAATADVPIIANDLESDPIASGYVASLSHPGGNLTGEFLDAPTLCGKWLQQITDVVPGTTRIGVLWDATTGAYQLDAIKTAAHSASITLVVMEFRDNEGLDRELDRGIK